MHKIEYYIDNNGPCAYDNEFDQWDGELHETDHEAIVEIISLWHASRRDAYDLFPCDIDLVELRAVPEFTARRIEND